MSKQNKVTIRQLPTGVRGLDEIFGGGLPEYSFNIIGGAPGCGKTTLAHQIVFANATPERPALYFTVLGEPALKMLRYHQQYEFFDHDMLKTAVRFVNLSQLVLEADLTAVLDEIIKEVTAVNAAIVVVDSFRTVMWKIQSGDATVDLQAFVQRLALYFASWQATTFLIGEYGEKEIQNHPVFTVADGLIWLHQQAERNSIVRKLQVMKMRGQASVPGMHTVRITNAGLQAFPRTFGFSEDSYQASSERVVSMGVPSLDVLMNGGVVEGDSLLISGPSGSGKSVLGSQFIHEGLGKGEPGIIMVFKERPEAYIRRARKLGMDFTKPIQAGLLEILYLRPLDLSVDETVHEIAAAVKRTGAKRLVIDSLAGFEMALAPGFRTDFRESLYRMITVLKRLGVTILSTVETQENFTSFGLSTYDISFLSDDIVRLRYVSIQGQLRKLLVVVKMRSSHHSIDMYEYGITPQGFIVGRRFEGYRGLISGIPGPWDYAQPEETELPLEPTSDG
ncbi:MAG TPA: ATPase domain-containing protein [Oligoflexus sp.]|uniref:ATPase domain-containing protein n=1 Tax=Oligoflexus sp. TaxID=1971216 RepID=UPI002D5A1D3B|nr:ATPase domain-containing protein [Oligoflexus sp.]HYX36515.1 ATPase domain-containing protein [Oligoflexus sp.]